jgi:hypothetical protein
VVDHYVAQLEFFLQLYQSVGLSKSDAAHWARGAVFGQIYGAAALDDDSQLDDLAGQFLREAADGQARYDFPLVN